MMSNINWTNYFVNLQKNGATVLSTNALQLLSALTNLFSIHVWLDFPAWGMVSVGTLFFAVEFATKYIVREVIKVNKSQILAFLGAMVITVGLGIAMTAIGVFTSQYDLSIAVPIGAVTSLTSIGSLIQLYAQSVNEGMEERHVRLVAKREEALRIEHETELRKVELQVAKDKLIIDARIEALRLENQVKEEAARKEIETQRLVDEAKIEALHLENQVKEEAARKEIETQRLVDEAKIEALRLESQVKEEAVANKQKRIIENNARRSQEIREKDQKNPSNSPELQNSSVLNKKFSVLSGITGRFTLMDAMSALNLGRSTTYNALNKAKKAGVIKQVEQGVYEVSV